MGQRKIIPLSLAQAFTPAMRGEFPFP